MHDGTIYLLAEMAEKNTSLGWVQKAVAAVHTWLRENRPGFRAMKMSARMKLTITTLRRFASRPAITKAPCFLSGAKPA